MKKIFPLVFAIILIIFAQGASAKILDISLSENNFQLLQSSEIGFEIAYNHNLPGKLLKVETNIEAPKGIQIENSAGQYHEFYYSQTFPAKIVADKDTTPGIYEVEITTKTKADKQVFFDTEKMHIKVLENNGIVYKTEKTSTKAPEIANVKFSDYVIALTRGKEKEFSVEFENLGSESNFVAEYSDSNPFVKINSANKEFLSSTGGKIFFTAKANEFAEKGTYLIPISLRDKASGKTYPLGAIKIVVKAFYNIDILPEKFYEVEQGIETEKEFTVKNNSGFETTIIFTQNNKGSASFPEKITLMPFEGKKIKFLINSPKTGTENIQVLVDGDIKRAFSFQVKTKEKDAGTAISRIAQDTISGAIGKNNYTEIQTGFATFSGIAPNVLLGLLIAVIAFVLFQAIFNHNQNFEFFKPSTTLHEARNIKAPEIEELPEEHAEKTLFVKGKTHTAIMDFEDEIQEKELNEIITSAEKESMQITQEHLDKMDSLIKKMTQEKQPAISDETQNTETKIQTEDTKQLLTEDDLQALKEFKQNLDKNKQKKIDEF